MVWMFGLAMAQGLQGDLQVSTVTMVEQTKQFAAYGRVVADEKGSKCRALSLKLSFGAKAGDSQPVTIEERFACEKGGLGAFAMTMRAVVSVEWEGESITFPPVELKGSAGRLAEQRAMGAAAEWHSPEVGLSKLVGTWKVMPSGDERKPVWTLARGTEKWALVPAEKAKKK